MAINKLENLGMSGLNSDTPSQKLDASSFNTGDNLRPFDGSLQAVYDFRDANKTLAPDVGTDLRQIYGFTQWTKSGSDELHLAYLYDTADDTTNLRFQAIEDIDGTNTLVEGAVASTPIDNNSRWDNDMFAFNDILIINDGNNIPVWLERDDTNDEYTTKLIPGWPSGAVTSITAGARYVVLGSATLTVTEWDTIFAEAGDSRLDYPTGHAEAGKPVVGQVFTASAALATDPVLDVGTPVIAERMLHFNNRLVALNISEEYLGTESYGNNTMLWSSQITQLGTLDGLTFEITNTNSAGDDISTESVGEFLDAGLLGGYLIAYKEDSVLRYIDSGSPLYLTGELIFEDDGLYSPGCFEDIGDSRHFVVGNYGIYLHDGGVNKENISRGKIEKALYESVDPDKRDRTFTYHHAADKEVWVCYGSVDQVADETGCDKAFIYNYSTQTWYSRTLPTGGIRGIESTEINGELKIYGWGDNGIQELGNERDDTSPFVADGFVTFDKQSFGDSISTKRIHELNLYCGETVNVNLTAQNKLQEETPAGTELSFDPLEDYKIDYRLHGRFFNLKLTQTTDSDDAPTNPQITGLELDIRTGGRR